MLVQIKNNFKFCVVLVVSAVVNYRLVSIGSSNDSEISAYRYGMF